MSKYRYTVHIDIYADSDVDAILKAVTLTDKDTESVHVTDADDWAEACSTQCASCGSTDVNRNRVGNGSRMCFACMNEGGHKPYPHTADDADCECGGQSSKCGCTAHV